MSSLSRLNRFTVADERARTALQWLSRTVVGLGVLVFIQKLLAPTLDVGILGPVQLLQRFLPSPSPSASGMGMSLDSSAPVLSLHLLTPEVVVSYLFWMMGLFVAMWALATIGSAFWYGICRLERGVPSAIEEGSE